MMTAPCGPQPANPAAYRLTRFVFLRGLGLVYSVAFLCAVNQVLPLVGEHGLLPVSRFLAELQASGGGRGWLFLRLPTVFLWGHSDALLLGLARVGLVLSLVVLGGFANAPLLAALWLLYMSFVHVGQVFYGYGWENLLLEAGFLGIFLAPPLDPRPFPRTPASPIVTVLLRWLLFRVMLGAGLIKLRGDPCWRDLTCLVYHYETQPIPNPLSYYLHQLPLWFHRLEALFNHFVELVVPWFVFAPRTLRHWAGAFLVLFQLILILSGNLSFLNWLTLVVAIACFDDGLFARILPGRLVATAARAPETAETKPRAVVLYALAAVIGVLSVNPVANMVSPAQVMNTSFDPFDLVNTYGAFGTIGRERDQVVLEGTDAAVPGADATWTEYLFKCQPVDVDRRPCVISPYHVRLDWQMWFAAMSSFDREPWLVHLVYQLLQGDPGALGLLAADGPFRDHPPRFIRARLFRYEFTRIGEPTTAWWRRRLVGEYAPPLSLNDPVLLDSLAGEGFDVPARPLGANPVEVEHRSPRE
jgi:hypothetical protein